MLPNMTSSKSSRPSMFSSSLSLPSLRSSSVSTISTKDADPSPKSTTAASTPKPRSKLQRKSTINVLSSVSNRLANSPERSYSPDERATEELAVVDDEEEPVHSSRFLISRSKSRTWSSRLTLFIPSLTSKTTGSQFGSLRRKPVGSTMAPPPPAEPAPPPPYQMHEPHNHSDPSIRSPTLSPTSLPQRRPSEPIEQSSLSPTLLLPTDISSDSMLGHAPPHPQIMAPTPPSPEVKRATLTKQDPSAQDTTQRNSSSTTDSSLNDESLRQKLQKENTEPRSRRNSLQQGKIGQSQSIASLPTLLSGATLEQRGRRTVSAQVPSPGLDTKTGRVQSMPLGQTGLAAPDGRQSPSTTGRLRRSWLPGGGRSRSNSTDAGAKKHAGSSYAWVMSEDAQAEYNSTFLKNGEKVPELWNESGNILVYLYPPGSGCGPSFKVMEFTVSSSYVFNALMRSGSDRPSTGRSRTKSFDGRNSLSADDASRLRAVPASPPRGESSSSSGELKLYLPTAPPSAESGQLATPGQGSDAELDRLIAIRNLFAFLTGQPLVATKSRPSTFQAFLQIAALLEEFGFMSPDGVTFGTAVDLSFEFYIDQLGLADCRHSREKTIEALILGERMRSLDLYSEAYAHAAGKYTAIIDLKLPLWEMVTVRTRQQIEKSHLDLVNRQHGVNEHIEQFEFPSLFAGIANSTSIPELRHVRFKVWRNSFMKLRSFVLSHYKSTFGSWPPKASSSKNPFAESGLNRLVLKALYSDMCALYDLLVDRENLTSRVMDEVPAISNQPGKMTVSAIRNIMSEFDRSRPPVLPPVPYDLPQFPSMSSILETYPTMSSKEQIRFDKNVKENEMMLILNKAYNYDANRIKLPFLDKFKAFELREAKGKMAPDLVDQRVGYWLFLYVVIQSLPMLVIDAPGLKFTEGTEYFLCEPPMGNPPWVDDREVKKMWYEVAGGGGMVQLSTDAVLFSVEATYHRSHCWLAAKRWQGVPGAELPPLEEPGLGPLDPPPPVLQGDMDLVGSPPPVMGTPTPPPGTGSPPVQLRPRNLSPGMGRSSRSSRVNDIYRSSIAIGLEPVPMDPPMMSFGSHSRSSSQGPRPMSGGLGHKSRSVGNLSALNNQHNGSGRNSPEEPSGATFDDILGGGSEKGKKSGKKKSFGFF